MVHLASSRCFVSQGAARKTVRKKNQKRAARGSKRAPHYNNDKEAENRKVRVCMKRPVNTVRDIRTFTVPFSVY